MPTCPVCQRRIPAGQLLTAYPRRFCCRTCGSSLSCDRTLGLLPGMAILLFGPLLARAVHEGELSLAAALVLGAAILAGVFALAMRISRVHLIHARKPRNHSG